MTKMLGNGRLEAMCFDGAKRLCHIRGKLRKKVSQPEKPGQTSVICWNFVITGLSFLLPRLTLAFIMKAPVTSDTFHAIFNSWYTMFYT